MTRLWNKQLDEMCDDGERALRIAKAAGLKVGTAFAELVLGAHRLCDGKLAEVDQYFDRSIPLLRAGPTHRALDAVAQSVTLHFHRLDYAEVERDCTWLDRQSQHLGNGFSMILSVFFRGGALGNRGRISEALELLHEGMRLADLHGDRFWLSRFPNTIAWLHRELSDMETALRLDTENVQLAIEAKSEEAQANAHVNLGHSYLLLDESERALEHLREAERICDSDNWYRFKYNIRLQAELASYWTGQGDLASASTHAHASLKLSEELSNPKHRAWGHKRLTDISTLKERVDDARQEYETALRILSRCPCPTIEWKILKAAGDLAQKMT